MTRLLEVTHHGKRPELDTQEKAEIMRVIMESLGFQTRAKFLLYDSYEECAAIGVVERFDPYERRLLIDGEWFKVADIIGAEIQ